MFSLVYISSAVVPFDSFGLSALLEQCRRNNERIGVTGVLMYADGNILQMLEGDAAFVRPLVDRIETDPRHRGMIRMFEGEAEGRQFGRWSMALANPAQLSTAECVESLTLMRQALATPDQNRLALSIRILLKSFADNMR